MRSGWFQSWVKKNIDELGYLIVPEYKEMLNKKMEPIEISLLFKSQFEWAPHGQSQNNLSNEIKVTILDYNL